MAGGDFAWRIWALKRASSSPHIHAGRTVQGVMLEVVVALVPAGAFGVWYFGWRALLIIAVSVASAVFWEWLYGRMAKKPCTVGDLMRRGHGWFCWPITCP